MLYDEIDIGEVMNFLEDLEYTVVEVPAEFVKEEVYTLIEHERDGGISIDHVTRAGLIDKAIMKGFHVEEEYLEPGDQGYANLDEVISIENGGEENEE